MELTKTGEHLIESEMVVEDLEETSVEIIDLRSGVTYDFRISAVSNEGLISNATAPIIQQTSNVT